MDRLSGAQLLWLSGPDEAHARRDDRRAHLHRAVRTAVATGLTGRQRQIVEGYFFRGLSQGELARQLGITQQVVHKCLYGTRRNGRMVGGALKKLRTLLTPIYARDDDERP